MANNRNKLWVGHIPARVTNEQLRQAFESMFGTVSAAWIACDGHGNSFGYGWVDFVRRRDAETALSRCEQEMFLIGPSLEPLVVEPFEEADQLGVKTAHARGQTEQFMPRMVSVGSPEGDVAIKYRNSWRALKDEKQQLKERQSTTIEGLNNEAAEVGRRMWEQHQADEHRRQQQMYQQDMQMQQRFRMEAERHQQEQMMMQQRHAQEIQRLQGMPQPPGYSNSGAPGHGPPPPPPGQHGAGYPGPPPAYGGHQGHGPPPVPGQYRPYR